VLQHWGFGDRWCSTISGILFSSKKILLNGSLGQEIQHQWGLRQGDLLSRMLFILDMDVLNVIVQKANDMGLLQPLARHPLQHRVSLYTDDVIMYLRPAAMDIDLFTYLMGA
jgi:hypothetical protein